MSNDTIKRSDAIDAIGWVTWYHQNRNKDMVEGANSYEHQAWYKSQDIYEALENVPSTDRPQGEWVHSHKGTIAEGLYCSNCGKHGHGEKFCPNCGCRMKGADDE